jgi:5-deoxy-glucuronate isomerase
MSLIKPHRQGFKTGVNPYVETLNKTGMDFDIFIIKENEAYSIKEENKEVAVIVIEGIGTIEFQESIVLFDRPNWVDNDPTVIHMGPGEGVKLTSSSQARIAVVKTENEEKFKGRIYLPDNIDTEHRGKGQLDDTCYRLVRLAFDDTISPKEAKLVIGEVLNFPGKWSSYPPHHHSQPELYYYELSPDWGYGHGELGDDVYKIKNGDVLAITDSKTHSQTSAPGFHMYYLWAIRHDDKKRYDGFTYIKSFEDMLEE